jgi:spermidine synthase
VRSTLSNLRQVFAKVTPYFVHIPLYGSVWGFACASDVLDPRTVPPQEADRILAQRGVKDLRYYNGDVHQALFALPNYIRELVA